MPDWRDAAVLAFVSHDLFWITMTPSLGLPAVLASVGLQACITFSRIKAGGFGLANESAVLVWLLGGVTWTCSEFLWDGHAPAGFLKDAPILTELDKAYDYPIMMTVAVGLMAAGAVALVIIHLARWGLFVRQVKKTAVQAESLTQPLMQCEAPESSEIPGPVRCLPLPIYGELFLLPWIFMDTSWALANVLDLWKIPKPAGLFCFTSFVGYAAVILQTDCIRRMWAAEQRRDAVIGAAELFWVAGNIVWLTEDMLTDDNSEPAKLAAAALFSCGVILGGVGMLDCLDDDDDHAGMQPEDLESSGSLVQAELVNSVDVDNRVLRLSATPPLKPMSAKKRHRSSRSKKTEQRQEANVILLSAAEGGAEFVTGSVQRVAAIALEEAEGAHDVLALFDLARMRQHAAEWCARFPFARPYYALGSPDSQVARMAVEGGSSLSCATPKEISLALSLGVPPEDLFFSEPCKPRSHLRFAASTGVRLMTFYDDAELRKIAVECPGALLLLCIVADEDCHGAVRFGASRAEWSTLLKSASALGMRVTGVSLRSGPRGSGTALAPALGAARDLMAMLGNADVLDLGSMWPENTADEEVLGGILQDWPSLRVLAECNASLCNGAVSLLTRIAGRCGPDYVLGGGRLGFLREVLGASGAGWRAEALVEAAHSEEKRCRIHVVENTGGWDALPGGLAELPELSDGDWLLWRQVDGGKLRGLDLVDLVSKGAGINMCYFKFSEEGRGNENVGNEATLG